MPLDRLAAYCAEAHAAEPPAEATHAAKRCLVDWFAATVPGGAVAPATLAD